MCCVPQGEGPDVAVGEVLGEAEGMQVPRAVGLIVPWQWWHQGSGPL